ncbi:enoyl-[acyl-carrier-protein] reductase FabV [Levilactobacillus tujiorum]|uniref:enoyl-[acyl-carrier-protein] reductase FabV n=1 Tax=Levilactobacillus tujiorum TaxID=2912243 RepID=UPI001B3B1EDE|nr:enoyl-[acyl-carrier-protein] reductase FabV [Levilactobacillus tujiorum]
MQVAEKIVGNVSRSVNPFGLKAMMAQQIQTVRDRGTYAGAKCALILGGSASYGLGSRLTAAFGQGATTISVGYARPPHDDFLGAAGWWNQVYFKQAAERAGLIAQNFNANAFLPSTKQLIVDYVRQKLTTPIDLVVYSVAAPKRANPANPDEVWRSVIKPIGAAVTAASLDLAQERLIQQTIQPATPAEITATTHVMGGEDWERWLHALHTAGVLAPNCKTILFSYEGPQPTAAIYRDGTLGRAKRAAEASAQRLQRWMAPMGGEALISVNQSAVTKASAVIPGFSRYMLALLQAQRERGGHESTVAHQDRLFREMVYGQHRQVDARGRLRPDALEMAPALQAAVAQTLSTLTPATFTPTLPGYQLYRQAFRQLSGFAVPGVAATFDPMILNHVSY